MQLRNRIIHIPTQAAYTHTCSYTPHCTTTTKEYEYVRVQVVDVVTVLPVLRDTNNNLYIYMDKKLLLQSVVVTTTNAKQQSEFC